LSGQIRTQSILEKQCPIFVISGGLGSSLKYIHSPHSTDFAVLFLPTEGLFAEVIRRPGLVDALQREFHINGRRARGPND
jgi:hypothetical protein